MVGASLVGTAGGVWLTLIRLAKSLMDAVQWDSGGHKGKRRTAAVLAQVRIPEQIVFTISLNSRYMVTSIASEHSWMGVCSGLVQTAIPFQTKVAA